MIRFNLDEIAKQIPTLQAQLVRARRHSPPGRWKPFFRLAYITLQDEETDKWVGWVRWNLFDSKGAYPCRDTGKNESISRTDPPDYFPTEQAAAQFSGLCIVAMRKQYNEWIEQDFSKSPEPPNGH